MTDSSPTYLCSPRHLRRLLKRGNGRFWTLQEDKSGAWRLPNRYRGPRCHRRLPAGRRRRLRRQLAGLRTHGGAGNGRIGARRYFSHAGAAARAQGNGRDRYWPLRHPGYLGRRMVGLWLVWAA